MVTAVPPLSDGRRHSPASDDDLELTTLRARQRLTGCWTERNDRGRRWLIVIPLTRHSIATARALNMTDERCSPTRSHLCIDVDEVVIERGVHRAGHRIVTSYR